MAHQPLIPDPAVGARPGASKTRLATNYRWVICALLFFAATINYMDRHVLGLLAETLEAEVGWSEAQYGYIVMAFQATYALSLMLFGRFIDVIGTKRGFNLAVIWWSLAAAGHALARTTFGFGVARAFLGVGEAGNFPASIKAVAEWFPRKERAFATGIFNSGTNVGVIFAVLLVPVLTAAHGWQTTFVVLGAIGFLWVIAWSLLYTAPEHSSRVSPEELAYIQSDPPEPTVHIPWARLLPHRQTWAFALGKFMTDPIWWFYLYWLAKYLQSNYGISLSGLPLPLLTVYILSDFGSIAGGWLSSYFIRQGWSVNRGRKTAMFICALMVTPMLSLAWVNSMWGAIIIVGIAAAGHQAWSANIFTTASDMFPKRAVASVVGVGGMFGAIGGMLFAPTVGNWLGCSGVFAPGGLFGGSACTTENYVPVFFLCGFAYLAALLVIHLLVPRLEQARIDV